MTISLNDLLDRHYVATVLGSGDRKAIEVEMTSQLSDPAFLAEAHAKLTEIDVLFNGGAGEDRCIASAVSRKFLREMLS